MMTRKRIYLVLLVLWAGFTLFLTSLPHPGIDLPFSFADKVAHFGFYGVMGFLVAMWRRDCASSPPSGPWTRATSIGSPDGRRTYSTGSRTWPAGESAPFARRSCPSCSRSCLLNDRSFQGLIPPGVSGIIPVFFSNGHPFITEVRREDSGGDQARPQPGREGKDPSGRERDPPGQYQDGHQPVLRDRGRGSAADPGEAGRRGGDPDGGPQV